MKSPLLQGTLSYKPENDQEFHNLCRGLSPLLREYSYHDPTREQDRSPAEGEWIRLKRTKAAQSENIDKLMNMVGLEEAKAIFVYTWSQVKLAQKKNQKLSRGDLNLAIFGSRGIGRSEVEQLYDALLEELKVSGYACQYKKGKEADADEMNRLYLPDYSDDELHRIMMGIVTHSKWKIEGGPKGEALRMMTRKVYTTRGRKFYHVHALKEAWNTALDRQRARVRKEQISGKPTDALLLNKADLIGPDPAEAFEKSAAWTKLQAMVGLESVKDSVKILFHRATRNQYRLQNGQPPLQTALNRVFLGPPGTGKTTVGKLYGQILADLGLLSDGAVLVKNPSDFIGAYVGWSEKQTKKILEEAKGKVLIIDDAYMLYPGSQSGTGRDTDVFRTAVIDTLVAELDNAPGNDRCVILLGYEEPMQEMFRKSNPGLARRFALNDAFHFTDFTVKQLGEILDLKIKGQGLQATDEARDVALQMLEQACHRPNFGNGGEVENLISQAKDAYEKRAVNTAQFSSTVVFTPGDFDLHHDRHLKAAARCKAHFQDMIGVDDFVHQFQQYQAAVATMRRRGVDPRPYIPFTFVFQGPPGTGKTSTARKMAQLFYDMGFLSAAELIECSASDLISPYQGQTGHRVTEWLERALGKVLFIDEAYRLARGENERQAVEELVDRLTKRRYARKLVVVLAGYKDEMVRLMLVNRGLNSRFETKIVFTPLPAEACWQVLQQELSSVGIEVTGDEDARHAAIQVFDRLANVQSWASARSVKKLSSAIILQVFGGARENESPSISTREIHRMLGRAEIDTLVEEAQAIVVKLSRKNAQWPAAVTNLADRLFQQYQLTGKLKTLNDAIGHMLEVLDTTPADHSQRPLILNNLSCYMSSRFERTGNPSDANLPSRHL